MGQVQIAKLTRNEWLKERQKGIGSSEIASILGLNPYQSPLDVYNSKIKDPDREPQEETPKTRAGLMVEPVVAKLFKIETGYTPVQDHKIRFNDKFPFIRANIDRMILRTDDKAQVHHETPGVLEMKNTEHRTIARWDEDESGVKQLPLYYWCQIQHQMFCTGWIWGFLYFFVSGYDTRSFYVEPNGDFTKDMVKEADIFWHKNVLKQIPPRPRTAEEVCQLFPKSMKDKAVEAGEALYGIHVEAYALDQELKEKDKKLTLMKNKIVVAMGDAEILTHQGQVITTYKSSLQFHGEKMKKEEPGYARHCMKSSVDGKVVKLKYPEMHERFSEKDGSRRFLFK